MDKLIYGLCALTAASCAALLLRGYLRTRFRLLMWSAALLAQQSRPLFLFLMLSFLIEAFNRVDMAINPSWSEDSPVHYVVRMVSYGLILVAIWDKNRRPDR